MFPGSLLFFDLCFFSATDWNGLIPFLDASIISSDRFTLRAALPTCIWGGGGVFFCFKNMYVNVSYETTSENREVQDIVQM
jgi:hypothetical protein